jgi:hypothetical protein
MVRVYERAQGKSRAALQFFLSVLRPACFVAPLADTRVARMVGRQDSRQGSRVRVTAYRSLRAQRNRIDGALLLHVLLNFPPV